MKKNIKKFFSAIMATVLVMAIYLPNFAYAANNNNVLLDLQDLIDDAGLCAEVSEISNTDFEDIWHDILVNPSIVDLLGMIEDDGFQFSQKIGAYKIDDTIGSNTCDTLAVAYENEMNESLYVMLLYNPQALNIIRIYAVVIDEEGQCSDYYDYEGNLISSDEGIAHTREIGDASFWCSVGSIIACGSWALMFMALPVVAPFISLGCETAFLFVCNAA